MNKNAQEVFDKELTDEQRDEFRIILKTDRKRSKIIAAINTLASQCKYMQMQGMQAALHKHEDELLADYYDRVTRNKTLTLDSMYDKVTAEQKHKFQITANVMHMYYDLFDSAAQDLMAMCRAMGYNAKTSEEMRRAAKPFIDLMRDLAGGMTDEWVASFGDEEDKVDVFAKERVRVYLNKRQRKFKKKNG